MVVKVFKGVWFFSLMATMAFFFYIYASLPETIVVNEGIASQSISRNGIFYITLALLAVFNAWVFVSSRIYADKSEFLRVWFYGLVIFLNVLLVVIISFLNLYNGNEKFDYESIGAIIYGSVGMVVLWASLWPIYFLGQRFFNKSIV